MEHDIKKSSDLAPAASPRSAFDCILAGLTRECKPQSPSRPISRQHEALGGPDLVKASISPQAFVILLGLELAWIAIMRCNLSVMIGSANDLDRLVC